jgi:hypothetical protein
MLTRVAKPLRIVNHEKENSIRSLKIHGRHRQRGRIGAYSRQGRSGADQWEEKEDKETI